MQKGGFMAKSTLAGARISAGYTQESLAEKLGVSRALINKLENGKADMTPYYLYAFCHITGFSESDIILPEQSTKR